MPRDVKIYSKVYPQDYKKPYGSLGIKFPMNANKSVNKSGLFNVSYTTEEQAVSNYVNLLLTKKGERVMQPNYGVGLWYYIFEQNTVEGLEVILQANIELQASQWLPYIFNQDIQIKNDINNDGHGMNIVIHFKVTENGANRTISIFPRSDNSLDVEIG